MPKLGMAPVRRKQLIDAAITTIHDYGFAEATVARIGEVQNDTRDLVLVLPMRWRLGSHRVMTSRGQIAEAFGHFGFGGSGGWADPSRDLAVAMVCNRGSGTPVGDLRLARLGHEAKAAADRRGADGSAAVSSDLAS